MFAPLLHQSFVFGILLTAGDAVLLLAEHDWREENERIEKFVRISTQTYPFLGSKNNFNYSELQNLFKDLCRAMCYAKNNIKQIKHN